MTDSTAPTTVPAAVATTFVTVSATVDALSFTFVMTPRAFFIGLEARFIIPRADFFIDASFDLLPRDAFFVVFFGAFLLLFLLLFFALAPFDPRDFAADDFVTVRFTDFFAISFSCCY
jgi:hypothetical protein